MNSYDVIVIGAGHNGLTAACYIARAGRRVLVLERRDRVGGAVCTQDDLIAGYKIDVGSSVHIMVHLTPVLRELALERYGLEYIDLDPWGFYPIRGTDRSIFFWKDVEKTCESIASVSARDAEAYRDFVARWGAINEGVFDSFLGPPTPGRILWTGLKNSLRRRAPQGVSSQELLRQIMSPYGRVIDETFESPHLRAAMKWLAAQSGPHPDETASGNLAGWQSMIHQSGAKRPKGGSGELTQAMAAFLRAHGGEIETSAEVEKMFTGDSGCRVRTGDGREIHARKIIAACHVRTTFLKLLDQCPDDLRRRVEHIRVGNGFGMIVRHAVSRLPRYPGFGENDLCHRGMQLLCPSQDHLRESYGSYLQGRTPREPAVIAMTFSAIDPGLAPPGKHILYTWAQYHPHRLDGEAWDDIQEREADKILELMESYAPGTKSSVLDRFIQSPLDLERRLGLVGGNVMHVEMSLDQMFFFRPLPELSGYRTPLPGLYLTGASCHPGGGVFAASGRSTAQVVLEDLEK